MFEALNYIFAVSIPFSHIGGYVAAGLGMFLVAKFWNELRREKLVLFIAVFLCYGTLRNLFSGEPSIGYGVMFGYFAHWLLPFMLGYGLTNNTAFRRSFWLFYGTFVVIIALSILAFFGYFYPFVAGACLTEQGLLKGLRSHISLGSICLLLSFMSTGQLVYRQDLRPRTRTLMAVATLFFLGALFLTGSRGYYIAAFLSYTGFAVYYLLQTRRWKLFFAAAASTAVCITILFFASPTLRARIHNTNAGDNNVVERISLYRVAVAEIKARPVTGFGPGQGIRQKEFFNILPEERRDVQRHPHLHCFYLNFAADFGLAGALLLVLIMGQALCDIRRLSFSADDFTRAFAAGFFWAFIGVLIGDSFDTLLRGPGTAMEYFWLAGLLLGRKRDGQKGAGA